MRKTSILLAFSLFLLVGFQAKGQILNTKLQVFVVNDSGNAVDSAMVYLYKTEADYDVSENAIQSASTDAKGRVVFKKLAPTAYFMHVEKGDMTNVGRGVKTTKLVAKKKNRLNVVIE